jgi:murein DD-endopeptidase MepM/ murein hydrolase activator NlpD
MARPPRQDLDTVAATAWARAARAGATRSVWLLGAGLLVGVLLAPVTGAAAAPTSATLEEQLRETEADVADTGDRLRDVRDRRGRAEEELASLHLRLVDARSRLVVAEGQVALAEQALADALAHRTSAQVAHEAAEHTLAATDAALASEEDTLSAQVVHTFKYGTAGATRGAMILEVLRRAEDPNAFAIGLKQLQLVVADQDATVTRVFELRRERAAQAEDAARTRGVAAQAAYDAAETLAVVEELRDAAAEAAAEVAAAEQRQREVLDSLRVSESETAAVLRQAEARAAVLRTELTRQLQREAAAREAAARAGRASGVGRLGLPGAGGGPDLPGGIVCPVVGAVAGRDYGNDWGYPRSGGRTHEGNDIFAPRGTPVVAVADGVVTRWNPPSAPTGLGGITVTYRTADGSQWYNAHLDTVAPGIAPGATVTQGQTIGTVGNTGNARTTPPHLHLGRQLGDGRWVNPYQTTSPVCR